MSKEWLEKISKNATGIMNMDSGTVDSIDLSIIDFTRLIQFAKEQTKRVQELEEEINETKDKWNIDAAKWTIVIGGLKEQNKRYREVVTQAISDLENECLWDALVRLKALEGEE